MTLPLRRKRQTTPPNIPGAKLFEQRPQGSRIKVTPLLLLASASIIALFPPALSADDQALAPSGSSLRLVLSASGERPAAEIAVRQGPPSSPACVTSHVASQPLFSHTKWEGPAATVPRESEMLWKGAFQAVRLTSVTADPGVVQTSAEFPLGTAQQALLPNPPRTRLTDTPETPPPAQPRVSEPPRPVQIAPAPGTDLAPPRTLEQELTAHPLPPEKCALPRDLKSIRMITADISVRPADLTGNRRLPPECSLGDTPFRPRCWQTINFAWTAASTCHNPIYFEDEQLERYGNSFGPVVQSTVSAVRFFATAPLVPYYMGVYPANECIYDLGQYRPGSCAPYYLDPLPLSVRGALFEGMTLGVLPAL